jgi:hypothetical protein
MAYALKGCGIVCRSDLVKRDLDAQKLGRRPVSALLPPRFEHSRRFYIGEGAYISSVSGAFPENPVLDACLVEQQPLINQRVNVLKSVAQVRSIVRMHEQERQKDLVLSEGACVRVCVCACVVCMSIFFCVFCWLVVFFRCARKCFFCVLCTHIVVCVCVCV